MLIDQETERNHHPLWQCKMVRFLVEAHLNSESCSKLGPLQVPVQRLLVPSGDGKDGAAGFNRNTSTKTTDKMIPKKVFPNLGCPPSTAATTE